MSRARKIVFYCSIAVLIAATGVIVLYLYRQSENSSVYEDLPNQVITSPAATPKPAGQPSAEPSAEPYVSPIDFEALWEINSDIYAWIEIPGTNVAYPVVQHPTDDTYYLNHTIDGKSGLPGSIYTESSVNGKDFSDYNTIIYGHNMRSAGTMFNGLLNYRDAAFMEENGEIVLYTPDAEYHYQIFAAVTYSNAYIPYYYDSGTQSGRQAYLDSLTSIRDMNSHVLTNVEVTSDSRLLSLSTCVENVSERLEKRFLVVAVLAEGGTSAEGTAK